MKRRILAGVLAGTMVLGSAVACSKGDSDGSSTAADNKEKTKIKIMAFTDEVPKMLDEYMKRHPEDAAKYEIVKTIVSTSDNAYQPALDQALAGKDAPDIYVAEAAFVLKYTQGDAAKYAATYKELGIDVDKKIEEAQIAPYTVEIGSRDGEVVGLGYQSTGGAFIYRRSIAKDVFGTDDPEEIEKIIGTGSGNWDKFWEAAEKLAAKDYAIVSGDGDIWHAVENSSDQGWVVDGKLTIDPKREALLDISKKLKDNNWHHDTKDWTEAWYADMAKNGNVFGFFGPAWLINYTIGPNSTAYKLNADGERETDADGSAILLEGTSSFGDWAVCGSPVGFFWGGSWVLASKDTKNKEIVAKIIEWITLDCTKDGLQYAWANGTVDWDNDPSTKTNKDVVASNVVMSMSDGTLDFLGGQDMFPAFIKGNTYANGKNLTQYDETINTAWRDQVRQYAAGNKTREQAIKDFKAAVGDNLEVTVD